MTDWSDHKDAAEALKQWFVSQNIPPGKACEVMGLLIASAICQFSGNNPEAARSVAEMFGDDLVANVVDMEEQP